jgi:hypothetical protein
MKKAIAILAVVMISGVSQGALQVLWSGLDGFLRSDDGFTVTLPQDGTPLLDGGGSYLAQLLFTPSGTIAPAFPGGVASGDNVVLDSVVVNFFGDEYGGLPGQSYAGAFNPGFVFARIFDVGSDVSIGPGDWYYDGWLLAAVDESDPSVFQSYVIHQGTANDPTFNTDILNLPVIPEPSVFALMGLGGLFLMIRRRFIKS